MSTYNMATKTSLIHIDDSSANDLYFVLIKVVLRILTLVLTCPLRVNPFAHHYFYTIFVILNVKNIIERNEKCDRWRILLTNLEQ